MRGLRPSPFSSCRVRRQSNLEVPQGIAPQQLASLFLFYRRKDEFARLRWLFTRSQKRRKVMAKNHGMTAILTILVLALCILIPVGAQSWLPALPGEATKIDRFENEIKAFEKSDKVNPVKTGETLFVGSSTFRLWNDFDGDFRDVHGVNRAFGGATIDEINHYANRIVIPYKPSRIVFYAGTNDLADGDSAKQVFDDFMRFERIVHSKLPGTKIYFVSASPGPIRVHMQKRYEDVNRLVSAEARRSGKFEFVDIRPVMYKDGKLRKDYFGFDRLHMNRQGQEAWKPIIKSALNKRN